MGRYSEMTVSILEYTVKEISCLLCIDWKRATLYNIAIFVVV